MTIFAHMTFAQKVYDAVGRIPKGRVATYGQIAEIIGCPGGSRAVGNALHVNPYAPIVPCHRVVASDGSLGANFGAGGPSGQYSRLKPEGVIFLPAAPGQEFGKVDRKKCGIVIERHPLEPFLPENSRILFLGSFPPPKERWSMEFFYPNWINDFWRIQGLIHFADAHKFEAGGKCFDEDRIIEFCKKQGLAFFDTAVKVCRWKGNASDEFLEILEPSNITEMLSQMPQCSTVVTTGGKSSEEFASILNLSDVPSKSSGARQPGTVLPIPPIGSFADISIAGRPVRWWRMPSSSRAFPMSLQKKAEYYSALF